MKHIRRTLPALGFAAALLAVLASGPAGAARRPAPEPASAIPMDSPVRANCVMCHRVDAEGRIPKIEAIRTTPDQWASIVQRMERIMKMRQLPTPEPEQRRAIVKQLSDRLALSPQEFARVTYAYEGPTLVRDEAGPDDHVFHQTCMGCHSYAKIQSYRRTPASWAQLKDFHVAMWPTILLIFGEYDWPSTATGYLQQMARQFPRDSASWKAWKANKHKPLLPGTWYVSGSQPGRGEYDGQITFTGKGGGVATVTRTIRFADGASERWSGQVQLYAGHLGIGEMATDNQKARLTVTLNPDDVAAAGGRWYMQDARHVYGQEQYYRNTTKAGRVLRVSPRAIYRLAPPATLAVKVVGGPAHPAPRDVSFGDPQILVQSVKRLDANTLEVGVRVGDRARIGAKEVRVGAARARGLLVVADKIDYLAVAPTKALARLGGIRYPKQAVRFVAQAYANGPDGNQQTKDDLYLGPVQATWSVEAYHVTNFDASNPQYSGTIDQSGLFLPADESINMATATRNNNGRVWVVARYRPGAASRELTARAYLLIGFPDLNRAIN